MAIRHLSLLCRLSESEPHEPCYGECDRAFSPDHAYLEKAICHEQCECWCHMPELNDRHPRHNPRYIQDIPDEIDEETF